MSKSKQFIALVGTVAAVAGAATVANGALSASPEPSQQTGSSALNLADHPLAKASGADLSRAQTIATLSGGARVIVAPDNDGGTCVLFTGGTTASSDICATARQIQTGVSANVLNDCSKPAGLMQITAVLPAGPTTAKLVKNDGSEAATAAVSQGVALFESTTPEKGQAYPVRVEAVDANGKTFRVALPVPDGKFCIAIPTS